MRQGGAFGVGNQKGPQVSLPLAPSTVGPHVTRVTEITSRLTAALADRYTIERRLGEGGMATVYLADVDLQPQGSDLRAPPVRPEVPRSASPNAVAAVIFFSSFSTALAVDTPRYG